MARSMTQWLARGLAVLLPIAILFSAYETLQRPTKPTGKAAAFDRRLAESEVQIVVLGSSLARTDVDPALLASEMGIDRRGVVMLTLPNATAAHWYAVMKNRVFANGHQPRVVLLVGALSTMVTPEVLKESNVERLVNQLSENEPVIGEKVFGTQSADHFRWLYMKEQAGQWRDHILNWTRDQALLYTFSKKGKIGEARKLAERANEYAFADDRMAYELHSKNTTGLALDFVDELATTDIDIGSESLIPDLVALGDAHQSSVVFVRTPFPPSNNENDKVPPTLEREAIDVMGNVGAGYLDLRSLNLDDSFFQDMRHMNPEGSAIFTAALASSLRDMGVMAGRGAAVVREGLQPSSVTRAGAPPAVPPMGDMSDRTARCRIELDAPELTALSDEALSGAGLPAARPFQVFDKSGEALPPLPGNAKTCDAGLSVRDGRVEVVTRGPVKPSRLSFAWSEELPMTVGEDQEEVWWVYPGTTLRFDFDEGWAGAPEDFQYFLLGHAFGGRDDATVDVHGQAATLQRYGTRVWATGTPSTPDKGDSWTLEVNSPADGPFLLIQNLAVGAAPRTTHLIGRAETLTGGSIRVVGGKVEDTNLAPVFTLPPPPMRGNFKVRKAPRGVGVVSVNAYALLADAPNSKASRPHGCSPIRVYEDGVMLDGFQSVCLEMATKKAGRSCHAAELLYFASSDGSNPVTNGREYTLSLAEDRICDKRNQEDSTPLRGMIWLYPGDEVTLTFPNDQLADYYDGANKLELELESFGMSSDDGVITKLIVDDEVKLQETLLTPTFSAGVIERFLEPALPPRQQGVQLLLRNSSSSGFTLVRMATLAEEYDYGFGAVPVDAKETVARELGEKDETTLWPVARVERLGEIPEIPPLKDVREARPGVWEGHAFQLWPVSNSVLRNAGRGAWSPVGVRQDGVALSPVGGVAALVPSCKGCFLHVGQSVVWTPMDGRSSVAEVVLNPAAALPDGAGGEVYWVYPGGGLAFFPEAAASSLSGWTLFAEASVMTVGKNKDWPTPRLAHGSEDVPFTPTTESTWRAKMSLVEGATTAVPFEIEVSEGGPYVLLTRMTLFSPEGQGFELLTPR